MEVLYTKFGGRKVSRSGDMGTSGFGGHFDFWTPVPVFVDLEVLYTKFGGGKVSRSRDKVTSGFGGHFEF